MRLKRTGDPERVGEVPDQVRAADGVDRDDLDRDRADHDHEGAGEGVGPLVADEPRRDPLVDDVGLLEEELPGRYHNGQRRPGSP